MPELGVAKRTESIGTYQLRYPDLPQVEQLHSMTSSRSALTSSLTAPQWQEISRIIGSSQSLLRHITPFQCQRCDRSDSHERLGRGQLRYQRLQAPGGRHHTVYGNRNPVQQPECPRTTAVKVATNRSRYHLDLRYTHLYYLVPPARDSSLSFPEH